jgi:formate dehydrogenase subunit gamma
MLILLALFHLIVGKAKLVNGRSGQEVPRWSVFERTLHWYVTVLFIVLGLTGLSLLYGRAVIIPLMGKEAFAAYASLARAAHNYLGPFFILGLAVMIIIWLKENIPSKGDWDWFKQGGGYLGKSHPHAGRVNGGEKLWFWALVGVGIGVSVTGILLDFPNLGLVRSTMQLANLIHSGCGILLIAFALGHIYIGTLGNEGTLEGMVSGRVDAEWAKQHHDLWYEEVKDESSVEQAPPSSAVSSKTAT